MDIANRHIELERIFAKTPYSGRWKDQFSRIEGALVSVYTPTDSKSIRATRIPRSAIRASAPE